MYIRRKTLRKLIWTFLFLLVIWICGFKLNLLEKIFYPYPYEQTIEKYAAAYEIDPLLVIAVIREESHFQTNSNSHKGAVGLMQLMPETAREIAAKLKEDYSGIDLNKPEDNIRYGTWYLAALDKDFSGNSILALAAYNAGSRRVKDWVESSAKGPDSFLAEDIPFRETREYVNKVLSAYKKYESLYPEK